MLTLIVIALIALIAICGYYETRINRINADLTAANNLLAEWIDYGYAKESELDNAIAELNRISREYGTAITNWKVKNGHIPSVKVPYTDKTKHGDPITRINTQLGLFPTESMFTDGEFKPQYDDNGFIIYAPIKLVDTPIATNGNGHKVESPTTDDSKPSDSSKRDNGNFSVTEPDYKKLAAAYATNKKYAEFISKVKSANKAKTLTQNQTNYLLAKFDQWELGKAPNNTDEYSKRVTSEHLAKNK